MEDDKEVKSSKSVTKARGRKDRGGKWGGKSAEGVRRKVFCGIAL